MNCPISLIYNIKILLKSLFMMEKVPNKKQRQFRKGKNKSKRGDIIFDKMEENFDSIDDGLEYHYVQPKVTNLINSHFHSSEHYWMKSEDFKNLIVDNIKEKIQETRLDFSTIFQIGLDMDWNLFKMNIKIEEYLKKHELKAYSLTIEKNNQICMICQEEKTDFYSLECCHRFCKECYRNYIKAFQMNYGSSIVKKTCPMQGCKVFFF